MNPRKIRGPRAEGREPDKVYSHKLQLDLIYLIESHWAKYLQTLSHFSTVLRPAKKISIAG